MITDYGPYHGALAFCVTLALDASLVNFISNSGYVRERLGVKYCCAGVTMKTSTMAVLLKHLCVNTTQLSSGNRPQS